MRLNLPALFVSWVLTVAVVAAGTAGLGVVWGKKKVADLKRGWNVVPVVVATRDLPAGAELKTSDLVAGQTLEQFDVSGWRAELGAAVGKRLTLPLKKNDVVRAWMYTERKLPAACLKRASEAATASNLQDSADVKAALATLDARTAKGTDGN